MNYIKLFATFFYTGMSPKAPGTVGSLACIPLVLAASLLGNSFYVAFTILLTLVAIFISHLYEQQTGGEDNSEIVIDEVVGFLIAMALVPLTWVTILVGFVLFRGLDIVKPFPISYLDKKVKGGLGVVLDDLVAGLMVNIFLQLCHQKWGII